jgi:hypothetical protein
MRGRRKPLGLASYAIAGKHDDAASLWGRSSQLAAGGDLARAEFWWAQTSAQQGDFFNQAQHLESAVAAAPLSYYGLRARAILDQEAPPEEPLSVSAAVPDWFAAEAWLTASYGPEDGARGRFESGPAARPGCWPGLVAQAADEIGPLADAATSPCSAIASPGPWLRPVKRGRTCHKALLAGASDPPPSFSPSSIARSCPRRTPQLPKKTSRPSCCSRSYARRASSMRALFRPPAPSALPRSSRLRPRRSPPIWALRTSVTPTC